MPTDHPGFLPSENDPRMLERLLFSEGYSRIAGVDEAGRGPLAGPVTAAAVILPADFINPGVRDSKSLSAARREKLYQSIIERAAAWAVGEACPEEIDRRNIRQATFSAMRRALDALPVEPDYVLVDGWDIPGLRCRQRSMFKGESQSISIAAASIVAKVTRDRQMIEYDSMYPGYGFGKHKGYGTREHMAAVRKFGPLPIHRLTFAGVKEHVGPDAPVR
ncbi:ribonuclease HII [candidate division KSB1 bacterium]